METLIHFGMVTYGVIVYNIYMINRNHRKIDLDKDGKLSKAELLDYGQRNFWGLLLVGAFIPMGALSAQFFWKWTMILIGQDFEFTHGVYWVIGLVIPIVQHFTRKK